MGIMDTEKLKVFLVEDEFVIREGIKKKIDWDANGYIFCGEAGDGELALPMIQKEKPDILVTDIRMPFMDGLELSRIVKKELPDTEIIILSGFEDFAYAKEAIRIGVARYLTKPINATELLAVIANVAEKIREKNKEKELQQQYLKEMQENVSLERRELFQHLVSGGVSTSDILKQAEQAQVSITAVRYCVVLVKLQSNRHRDTEFSDSVLRLGNEAITMAEDMGALCFDRAPEGKALLFMGDSDEQVRAKLDSFKSGVDKIVETSHSVSYFGAVGSIVGRISEIADSYAVAGRAFAFRFFEDRNTVLYGEQIMESIAPSGDKLNLSDIDPKHMNRSGVEAFLRTGTVEEVDYFVEAFWAEIGENAIRSNMFRQYLAMKTYFDVAEFAGTLGLPADSVETFEGDSHIFQNAEDTKAYISRILKEIIIGRENASGNKYDAVVTEVYKYVEAHYGEENLSLNEIAAAVNFSPSHLSTIFSQETGQTLIKYITDVRMGKARELLRNTQKKTGEISELVGYQDAHYFSYLFKKTQGMTPTEYRGGKTAEVDDQA